jgi:hypothetical protein
MDEINRLRLLGIQKISELGSKYYQAIIVTGYLSNHFKPRVLKNRCRTKTEAQDYALKVIERTLRRHKNGLRTKKGRRFS